MLERGEKVAPLCKIPHSTYLVKTLFANEYKHQTNKFPSRVITQVLNVARELNFQLYSVCSYTSKMGFTESCHKWK